MREYLEYPINENGREHAIGGSSERTAYQYSFVGPLSLSKGCDFAIPLRRTNLDETQDTSPFFDYAYRGSNPAVVTDATCYMSWIAEQYGLRLDRSYEVKASCSQSTGDIYDVNKEKCW